MNLHAIMHRTYSEQAYGLDENHIFLRFRCAKGDVAEAFVYYRDRFQWMGQQAVSSQQMVFAASDGLFDYFETVLDNPPARLAYYFELRGENTLYLCNDGVSNTQPAKERFEKFFELHYNHRADLPECAEWLENAIIYQIFPDSFADGRRSLLASESKLPRGDGGSSHAERGGTLAGIIENLDYISEMGFNCLYLNPIFTACTPHRYDTTDYYTIDPLLGTNEEFRELVQKAHDLGIKIILDGVFNHTGVLFFAFKDVMKNGDKSPYKDWFYRIDSYPVAIGDRQQKPNYATFAYTGYMPKVNTANPEACKYFLDVITHWVREYDIDGWRLDVADEVNVDFWRQARKAMKAVKRGTVLIGEIWGNASRWLEGDMFDSLMNYAVMHSCRSFLTGEIDAQRFGELVGAQLMRYKKPYQYAQMNLLGSHDTERFLGKLGGNEDAYKLALTYLYTYVGAPTVYYGDELGLQDIAEKLWRQTMPWERAATSALKTHIETLAKLRRGNMDAMLGRFEQLYASGRVFAFTRTGEKSKLTVVMNASGEPCECDIPGLGRVSLSPWEGRII